MKIRYAGIAVLVIVLDQITKWMATANLSYNSPVQMMPSFNFRLLHNHGAAFSFLSDAGGWQRWFFTIIASVISCVLVVWIYRLKPHERLLGLALSLVLGGAVGNLIDRVRFGYVVDFLDFFYKHHHWPAFNVADAAICVGTVLLLITSFQAEEDPADSKT